MVLEMQVNGFREKSLILAKQLYPDLYGDDLVAEADRIFKYLSDNEFRNFVSLDIMSRDALAFTSFVSLGKHGTKTMMHPFSPYGYQEDLMKTWMSGKDSIVVHARGMGITTMLCFFSLWRACFHSGVYMGYVAPNSAAIDEALRLILRLHASSLFELPLVSHYTNSSIVFSNGNKIMFLTPTVYLLGRSLSHLVVEGTGSIPLSDQDNLYSTMMFANHGHMIVAGTAGPDIGIFHSLATDPSIYGSLTTELPYSLHPLWTPQWEAQTRQQIGDQAYAARYNCEFYKVRE